MKTTTNKDKIVRCLLHTPSKLYVRENTEGEEPSRIISGYVVLFNVPSEPLWTDDDMDAREVIAPEALPKSFLDSQDIKMNMFHDRQLLLARSINGSGTLKYTVDEKGVAFEFGAPKTVDGDKALELVRRGDIQGCSFAFSTRYYDSDFVERQSNIDENSVNHIQYRVKAITKVYDFTLALDPYYPDTEVETRELIDALKGMEKGPSIEEAKREKALEQLRDMRHVAQCPII